MKIDIENLVNELKGLTFNTRYQNNADYEYEVISPEENDKVYKGERRFHICYGSFLNYYIRWPKAKGTITCYLNRQKGRNINNYLWMSIEQLKEHIEYCKSYLGLDFDYTIEGEYDFEIIVKLNLKRLEDIKQIKFVLFWLRYAFEFPSAIAMIDAYILKEKYYPEEELYNLLSVTTRVWNLIHNSKLSCGVYIPQGQSLGTNNYFIEVEEVKKRLGDCAYSQLVDIFTQNTSFQNRSQLSKFEFTIVNGKRTEYEENCFPRGPINSHVPGWFEYSDRLDLYHELYEILK